MIYIAFDLGTHTGWAALVDGQIVSGVWDFTPRRWEGGGMRFIRFRKQVMELIQSLAGDVCVYYEEVRRHLGTDAAHIYGGFQSHLLAFCEENKVPCDSIPVGTIKKHACGKGNADKAAMLAAARAKWPEYPCQDDNEADARWLLDLVATK